MYRFVQKHRWIPSLHLLGVAVWILLGTVLAGFAHEAQVQPIGVSIVTDFAGDDLQRLAGGKELSEEIQVQTEADDSERSSDPLKLLSADLHAAQTLPFKEEFSSYQLRVVRPRPALFPQPKRLFIEYEVFRI
ncbi:MAG: hypothetical protein ACO27L_05690 [Schleiferiaceae bacterium]|jgi:hypothetical protein